MEPLLAPHVALDAVADAFGLGLTTTDVEPGALWHPLAVTTNE
jgi:hypothetical protein